MIQTSTAPDWLKQHGRITAGTLNDAIADYEPFLAELYGFALSAADVDPSLITDTAMRHGPVLLLAARWIAAPLADWPRIPYPWDLRPLADVCQILGESYTVSLTVGGPEDVRLLPMPAYDEIAELLTPQLRDQLIDLRT